MHLTGVHLIGVHLSVYLINVHLRRAPHGRTVRGSSLLHAAKGIFPVIWMRYMGILIFENSFVVWRFSILTLAPMVLICRHTLRFHPVILISELIDKDSSLPHAMQSTGRLPFVQLLRLIASLSSPFLNVQSGILYGDDRIAAPRADSA